MLSQICANHLVRASAITLLSEATFVIARLCSLHGAKHVPLDSENSQNNMVFGFSGIT